MNKYEKLEQAYIELLKRFSEDLCGKHCKNFIECEGKKCTKYVQGYGGEINGATVLFKWSCIDFNYGECEKLENTPCNGCFDNDYKGFEWVGLEK